MATVGMGSKVDWGKYAPTRPMLWRAIGVWAAISLITTLTMYGLVLSGKSDVVIGGDFTAFHAAATASANGDAAKIYDPAFFQEILQRDYLGAEHGTLSWQYPPTYLLLMLPFAALPYFLGFTLWSTGTAAGFFLGARSITRDRLILFAIIAGPAAYSAFITGQNGFLTATFLLIAAAFPKSRPILAGIAAGLLTIKPHLGLLIPIAYLAAGCWRAMTVATLTAIALAVLSFLVFGAEPWAAFVGAVFDTGERLEAQILPLAKMTTPLSAMMFAGAPAIIAYGVYAASLLFSAAFVWRVWRSISDEYLRVAVLIAAVLMAAPYGFHYELIMLTIPGAILIIIGLENGWLTQERTLLAVAYGIPAFYSAVADFRQGISIGVFATLIIFGLTVRRALHEAPDLVSFRRDGAPSSLR